MENQLKDWYYQKSQIEEITRQHLGDGGDIEKRILNEKEEIKDRLLGIYKHQQDLIGRLDEEYSGLIDLLKTQNIKYKIKFSHDGIVFIYGIHNIKINYDGTFDIIEENGKTHTRLNIRQIKKFIDFFELNL